MKYQEEVYAKKMHKKLRKHFKSKAFKISIKGAGVHWECIVQRNEFSCIVNCFDDPEYYTDFMHQEEPVATSRINDSDQTIAAVDNWLTNASINVLHENFPFVDQHKRDFIRLRKEVMVSIPEIENAIHSEIEHHIADIYNLNFSKGNRACYLSFYGKNKFPDARFTWDECVLFEYQVDNSSIFANVLKKWIYDNAKPSVMRKNFPWLQIGELADYYEKGKPVEGEFVKSWQGIENFYEHSSFSCSAEVENFIKTMRDYGYDKTLRAGQSLWTLMLSRSRRYGLEPHQPYIAFDFSEQGIKVYCKFESNECSFIHPCIELNAKINNLLKRLESIPVS
ncbi:hypothetical protein [Candidatus Uabimicrobium sp. HlEnr_7]|uniref:hypothetical protein n=1 Tax=Candidatus Uabimicrobium helgolandensis TaxID=3095367 RepID=UPI003558B38F